MKVQIIVDSTVDMPERLPRSAPDCALWRGVLY